MKTEIKLVTLKEFNQAYQIVEDGRKLLKESNSRQWQYGHPTKELVMNEIKSQKLRGIYVDGVLALIAAFSLIPDPSYTKIINGKWLTNTNKYLTIHTLSVKKEYCKLGLSKLIFEEAYKVAKENNLISVRADTYKMNRIVQHIFSKEGFQYCGIIYLVDETIADDRYAYEKVL
jgi:GNAT superfamily N-acetyltransferase